MPLHVSRTVVLIMRRSKLYYIAYVNGMLCRCPSGAHVERRLFFSQPVNGRPPTGVMIPDAVQHNFYLLMMST